MKKKSISILGCGWLGFPLAKRLVNLGWHVKGTTTSKEKITDMKSVGIESYEVKLPGLSYDHAGLFNSEVLLINIPPGRGKTSNLESYEQSINEILKNAGNVQKLIFISSTSVYDSKADYFDETSKTNPESTSGRTILHAEKQIITSKIPHIILRFGGLAGPGRHPGRFLSGKTGLMTGNQCVNYLHLEDAIGVILTMLENKIYNEVFNVVAPQHPLKKDFYTKMALSIDLPPPVFEDYSNFHKREITADKLLNTTDYRFLHPNPMNFKFKEMSLD